MARETLERLASVAGSGRVAVVCAVTGLGGWARRRQNLDYPGYLHWLRRVPVSALLGTVPGGDYPHATAAALLLSIQATEASDPSGLTSRLLRVVAVLSPDGVRRWIRPQPRM